MLLMHGVVVLSVVDRGVLFTRTAIVNENVKVFAFVVVHFSPCDVIHCPPTYYCCALGRCITQRIDGLPVTPLTLSDHRYQ
jgi:hypothetical protein